MKRVLASLLLLGTILLSGCTKETVLPQESPVWAYWNAIEALIDHDPSQRIVNEEFLAFDFSGIDPEDLNALRSIAQKYCEENGYTFLEGTMDDLIALGYITTMEISDQLTIPGGFENGVLVSMEVISTSDTQIVLSVNLWKGNLASTQTTYTVRFQNGEWTPDSPSEWTIS